MRKLLALTLISYLLALSLPFVATAAEETAETTSTESSTEEAEAEDIEFGDSSGAIEIESAVDLPKMCPVSLSINYGDYEDPNDLNKAYQDWYETVYSYELSKTFDASKENADIQCGTINNYSKYLEKGDCSADGLIVTEITEVIAPDVELEDDEILTVYSGACCLGGETYNSNVVTCNKVVTLYADTYDKCTANLEDCEKRQWVIGSSGIGIVKLMVKQIFTFGVLSVGSIAVGTIVFQGIKISVSGVSGDITESKNKILQAIAGIVLLFLSGLILYAINPTFFG